MELGRDRSIERNGLLYPMMVIAAVAVIVFSILGIATVMGWLPSGLVGRTDSAVIQSQEFDTARSSAMFDCTECGVIESIRNLEQS
jgi:hypothetical protein